MGVGVVSVSTPATCGTWGSQALHPISSTLRRSCPVLISSANTMFEMEWRGRRVALKASNGRYVCMKKNGQLAAISDFVGEHSWGPGRALHSGSLPAQRPNLPSQVTAASGHSCTRHSRSPGSGPIPGPFGLFCAPGEPWAPLTPHALEDSRFRGARWLLVKVAQAAMAGLGSLQDPRPGWTGTVAEGGPTAPSPAARMRSSSSSSSTGPSWCCAAWTASSATAAAPTS